MIQLYDFQKEALQRTEQHSRCAVKGYEGLYEVSSDGYVFSMVTTSSRRKGKLVPHSNNGYLRVNLFGGDGADSKQYIHRLVAEAFIPNPFSYAVVNHIDGDKANNAVTNLEWCSQKQNIRHSFENGLEKRSKKTTITTCTGTVYKYPNMKTASLVFFENAWEIAHQRRKLNENEFYYKDLLIKVGDAICQG